MLMLAKLEIKTQSISSLVSDNNYSYHYYD